MNAAVSLLSKVDEAISSGSLGKRGEMLRHVTDLFIVGAEQCSEEDVALFDTVFTRLAAEIEQGARALLAVRLAPISKAPPITVRTLACDDAIEVAGPVLALSERLDDPFLVKNASTKGQEHLLAISRRRSLSEAVTDVLVARGDSQVVLSTAENAGARFSEAGFTTLVLKATGDDRLTECVGSRREIPRHLFLKLLDKASDAVRGKLEAVHPEAKGEVHRAVTEATDRVRNDALAERTRGYAAALAVVEALRRAGRLDDNWLQKSAQAGHFVEVKTALAVMSGLPLSFVERAMDQERADTIIVIAKALALSKPTVKALLQLHGGSGSSSNRAIEHSLASFDRLNTVAAREIVRFYSLRDQPKPRPRTTN